MSASTAVHSNAFNFMSYLQGGVDPRTGLYTLSIRLPEVKANDLQGPPLQLALTFSPLNTVDSGYGKGWNLLLSQFVPSTGVVSTLDGEVFKAEPGQGRFTLQEQKLDSFHLHDQGNQRYRLVHRSGLVEVLGTQGVGDNALALPEEVYSAQGHRLRFSYTGFNVHTRLASITYLDDNFESRPVLLVERTNQQVIFRFNPEGEQQAVFTLKLDNSQRVEELVLPTAENASWRLRYEDALNLGYDCIKEVFTPTGGHETLTYTDAHEFPRTFADDNPAHIIPPTDLTLQPPARLPRVSQHLVDPGSGQPPIDTRYSYTLEDAGSDYQVGNNFLGANLNLGWDNDGLDNLFRYTGVYLYGSVEQLLVGGKVVRKIQRQFNQFHLMTKERTRHLGADERSVLTDQEQSTSYHLRANVAFKDQARYCQLPGTVTSSWTGPDTEEHVRTRSEQTSQRTYHEDGNLHTETDVKGVTQTSEWYPAAGDGSDSPPDPEGFVRHLKSLTTTPAPSSAHPDAPVLRQRYRYRHYQPLRNSESRGWNEVCEERLVQVGLDPEGLQQETETELEVTVHELLIDTSAPFTHGRLSKQTVTRNGEATTTEFAYSKRAEPLAQGETVLVTEQTITGHDGTKKVQTLEHSILIGEPLISYDDNDVKIRYQYDALRRVISETVAPGEVEEATCYYSYLLSSSAGLRNEQHKEDVNGVITRTLFDGLNRAVEELRLDIDNFSAWQDKYRPLYSATYDAWGRLQTQTLTDWLGAEEADELSLTSQFKYDDWGQQCAITGPDGVTAYERIIPVGSSEFDGRIIESWREGSAGAKTGRTIVWQNRFDQAERSERRDAANQLVSLQVNTYDGLGRVATENVGLSTSPRVNAYRYDAFSRIVAHTLPDGSTVVLEYARHSRDDLSESIAVQSAGQEQLLGTRVFDGIDRITVSTTGGRKQVNRYVGSLLYPADVTTASGELIDYEYLPLLTSSPIERTLRSARVHTEFTATFTYNSKNARLETFDTGDQSCVREHYSTGHLRKETRQQGGGSYVVEFVYSHRGLLLEYQDVQGNVQYHEYDPQGRLCKTYLNELVTHFQYDTLGRLCSFSTANGSASLTTSLKHDDFDREIQRTFIMGDITQVLLQDYNDVDAMISRRRYDGANEQAPLLLEETYGYDERQRLRTYSCTGSERPHDPNGQGMILGQEFTFDALDNIVSVKTTLENDKSYSSTYNFENKDDPVQLTSIIHHFQEDVRIQLAYDANGNLTQDEQGRVLEYDALNRLLRVTDPAGGDVDEVTTYEYDAQSYLTIANGEQRFIRDDEIAGVLSSEGYSSFFRGAGQILAEQHDGQSSVNGGGQ
ncbi:RHS repeat domain-containing protein [Pseudomonas sp. microsymbiont 2]